MKADAIVFGSKRVSFPSIKTIITISFPKKNLKKI